jgi:hypothetical protein
VDAGYFFDVWGQGGRCWESCEGVTLGAKIGLWRRFVVGAIEKRCGHFQCSPLHRKFGRVCRRVIKDLLRWETQIGVNARSLSGAPLANTAPIRCDTCGASLRFKPSNLKFVVRA